jgi:hypothetical protein
MDSDRKGDGTHLSKPQEFDDAEQRIARAKLDVHYVPGEHDIIDENNGQASGFPSTMAARISSASTMSSI